MKELFKHRKLKTAQAPGTLSYTGDQPPSPVHMNILSYTEKAFHEQDFESITFETLDKNAIASWINIDGVHSAEAIKAVGDTFGIHPLILEDVMHVGQRPKVEHYENYFFIVLKMIRLDLEKDETFSEQVSLLVNEKTVISLQEKPGDIFDPIRNRIKTSQWRERKLSADYLAYALIDAIVDHYFVVLERIGEKIELLEQAIYNKPTPSDLEKIHHLKTEMIALRKSIWPLREVVSGLQRDEYTLIKKETRLYFKDVYDHTIQVLETIASFGDMLSSLQDLYISSVSNKMNEVMKVLTIISTIFIPPTFLAGVYGMNFEWIPELKWPAGYFIALGVMLSMMSGMAIYFKKKKWF